MKPIVYISGKIAGDDNFKSKFEAAEKRLVRLGYNVLNPCLISNLEFLSYEQYMHIDFALIDLADIVLLLPDWQDSKGATRERLYALAHGKRVMLPGFIDEAEEDLTETINRNA